jgi:hypothetical protein
MTQQNSGTAFQRGCGVLAIGLVFLCSLVALFAKIQADHVWDKAIHVTGTVKAFRADVVNTSIYTAKLSDTTKTVFYEYPVKEQIFQDRQTVPYKTFFFIGQKVPVMYLPDNPWDAQMLIDEPANTIQPPIAGIVGLIGLGIGIRMVAHQRTRKKQKRKPHEESVSI